MWGMDQGVLVDLLAFIFDLILFFFWVDHVRGTMRLLHQLYDLWLLLPCPVQSVHFVSTNVSILYLVIAFLFECLSIFVSPLF